MKSEESSRSTFTSTLLFLASSLLYFYKDFYDVDIIGP